MQNNASRLRRCLFSRAVNLCATYGFLLSAASVTVSCGTDDNAIEEETENRPAGWDDTTHGSNAAPNYELLFNDDIDTMAVHRIDLIIDESTYTETMDDLTELLGTCGGGGGRPGGGLSDTADPVWVPIDVRYDGIEWTHVGMRYKGNSSLQSAWRSCTKKLAFRLDFDQFEDEFPSIEDQRFFGFKKMTFSNGYKDSSLIRDKLGADIFRRAGIPSARGAFAQVYATIGDAEPQYFGMYSMIEDPSNRLLDTQFEDDGGNLYKPESQWGQGLSGTALQEEFEKKTNEEEADWSDVEQVIQALHDDTRTSDPAAWREGLEAHLNVDGFLQWAALNQAMVNWDTYGCMAHNYYLYADPSDSTGAAPNGRFTWFPWDLNESMLVGGRCNFSGEDGLMPASNLIGNDWPLIRYLLDDDVYADQFREKLARTIASSGGLDADWIDDRIAAYHQLISPYVVGPTASEQDGYSFLTDSNAFTNSASQLQEFVSDRRDLVNDVVYGN